MFIFIVLIAIISTVVVAMGMVTTPQPQPVNATAQNDAFVASSYHCHSCGCRHNARRCPNQL